MQIRIDPHTLERAQERGTGRDEVVDTIETGFAIPAKKDRQAKAKIYPFRQTGQGKFCEQKKAKKG